MDVFNDDRKREPVIRALRVDPKATIPVLLLGDFRSANVHWVPSAGRNGRTLPHIKSPGPCPWCPEPMTERWFGPGCAPVAERGKGRRWKHVIIDLGTEAYEAIEGRDLFQLPVVLVRGGSKYSPVLIRDANDVTEPASLVASLDHLETFRADVPTFDIVPHLWRMWGLTPESLKREQIKIHRPAKEA